MSLTDKNSKIQLSPDSSNLFELPLGRKVHVRPKEHCVLHTTRLCKRLFMQKSDFDLSDPNGFRMTSAYNCLHDPNLRRYLYRRDLHRHLIDDGFITEDDKVICSPTEFNKFKDYLAEVQLGWDLKFKMEQKKIVHAFLVQQEQGKITADESLSELIETLLCRGQMYFRNQEEATRERAFQRLWKDDDSSVLKLPKISEKNSLTSLFDEDEMVWKVKGRMMLEEIVKEVQRELRIERQKTMDTQTREKQKQELHGKKSTPQVERKSIFLEAIKKPRDVMDTGTLGSAPSERRPSLQKLKPLPKIKMTKIGSFEDDMETAERTQHSPSHTMVHTGTLDSEPFQRRLGIQKLKPLPKIKMSTASSSEKVTVTAAHTHCSHTMYSVATPETLTATSSWLTPVSNLQPSRDQLETTVENLVDSIMDYQFPYSYECTPSNEMN
ncbi:fibrous sheath-interacting protein 2-like [Scleropages formosus]|uniref:fibrous sheath-interacting protein 2-like n=1 Tax=Scleropages formosus TaxID=113540 RepID=UPI00087838A0|nr:fibrous sheath-interacting protein 2-like [Scleropages formosus]